MEGKAAKPGQVVSCPAAAVAVTVSHLTLQP